MFFVTLFKGDRAYQFKIDEFIQNLDKGFLSTDCGIDSKDIYFPLIIKGDSYAISVKSSKYEIRCNDARLVETKDIGHGDLYLVSSEKLNYSLLITSCDTLSLQSTVYCQAEGNVFIGRSPECDIVIDINSGVSRKCAAIRVDENNDRYIEDLSGKTGVYVNGRRETSKKLENGDEIFIMGTAILFFKDKLLIPAHIKTTLQPMKLIDVMEPVPDERVEYYVRTPRIIKTEEEGAITIDPPPEPEKNREMPFILTAGPSMTMSLAMLASLGVTIANVMNGGSKATLITSAVMAASMLAGALLWPALLRRYNKKQSEKKERHRQERYTAYLKEKEAEIKQKYDRSVRVLNENTLPHPSALLKSISDQDRRLWEKNPKDEDFLTVRLGSGERDFLVDIQSPYKGFKLDDDQMLDNAIALKEKYKTLRNVPISLSLYDKRVVGVVGDTHEAMKVFVSNIIATHSFDEVKLVFVYDSADVKRLHWLNDLPHVWSNDRQERYIATNKNEARTLFANLEEKIFEREERLQNTDMRLPHYLIFVLDEKLIEDISFARYMLNCDNNVGVSAVFFGKHFNNIPKECVAIIQRDEDVSGVYVKNENNNRFIRFDPDTVSDADMQKAAIDINSIKVKHESARTSVPNRVTFLDMYRVGNVDSLDIMNHWRTNISEKSLAAPIGIRSDGEVFSLDIHEKYHGCHGLVAGTTGSGKSEFLQAFILSLMVNYSPNEVAFVLVDFKGGDMARPFLRSPHLAATISNLSGNTLHRALLSLEAEVKSRQNTFNRAAELLGVDKIDINSYQKFYKDKKLHIPLPHLVIVIDEFAQLKTQHPEFMSKLVDIAQVGRSLGIHLILATQRPSGVVDPQIWSNSKFKVCLKVLDKQDSSDMLNRPDAALIKQPGRAFVQVGYDEIFELIQSGYSGADYIEQADYIDEDSISLSMVNWPAEKIRTAKKALSEKRSSKTQLEEVVFAMTNIGESLGIHAKQLWLPPLKSKLLLEECGYGKTEFDRVRWEDAVYGETVCGMADLPERQEQNAFAIDFIKEGHLAIYGSSGSGKSTLINTLLFAMALKYSPEMMNVFVMDFDGGSLASTLSMPHCSGYTSDADEHAVEEMLYTVGAIIDTRRELFAQNHCANYESYISDPEHKLPMILLILDNYSAFREKMYRGEDLLIQIVSAARSCGIYFVVTGNSKGAIYYKLTEQISNKIVLNMNDSGAYRDILNAAVPIVPESVKGRGLALYSKKAVEVQFAVPFDTESESMRMKRVEAAYTEMKEVSGGVSYDRILDEYPDAAKQEPADNRSLSGLSAPKSEPLIPIDDILETDAAVVLGYDIKTGRARGFANDGSLRVFVNLAGNGELIREFVSRISRFGNGKYYLISSNEEYASFENVELVSDIDAFAEMLWESGGHGETVMIDGFCDLYDRISDEALWKLDKALVNDLNANIVTFDTMERTGDYRDTGLYVHLVRCENGVVVGGIIDDALAVSLNDCIYGIAHTHREKSLDAGQAAIFSGNKLSYINIVEE